MALPLSGQISLNDIATEFGGAGSNESLSNYYFGGPYIKHGVYPNNTFVPSSGSITLSNFYGGSGYHNYAGGWSPQYTYYATFGFDVSYIASYLSLTVGLSGTGGTLLNRGANGNYAGYSDVWVLPIGQSVGTVYFAAPYGGSFALKASPFFGQPSYSARGNNGTWTQTYSSGAHDTISWPYRAMIAAKANSDRSITVYMNPSIAYTGDNGSDVTLTDMYAAFGYYAGLDSSGYTGSGYADAVTIGPY